MDDSVTDLVVPRKVACDELAEVKNQRNIVSQIERNSNPKQYDNSLSHTTDLSAESKLETNKSQLKEVLELIEKRLPSQPAEGGQREQYGLLKAYSHLAADSVAFLVSVMLAYIGADWFKSTFTTGMTHPNLGAALAYTPAMFLIPMFLMLLACQQKGHYSRFKSFWDELGEYWLICIACAGITIAGLYIAKIQFSRMWLLSSWALVIVLVPVVRWYVKRVLINIGCWYTPAIVIGNGKTAVSAALAIESDRNTGYRVASLVDTKFYRWDEKAGSKLVRDELRLKDRVFNVYSVADLSKALQLWQQRPYIILAPEMDDFIRDRVAIEDFLAGRRNLSVVPPLNGIPLVGTEISPIYKYEVLQIKVGSNLAIWQSRAIKRLFDVLVSGTLLLLLCPLFAFLIVKIRGDGAPVFYAQHRIGRDGQLFKCWKFRSMRVDSEKVLSELLGAQPELKEEYIKTEKLKNDPRVTPIGEILRKASLDELPQLYNVFRGDMSLVGPRPVREDELYEKYGKFARHYLTTPPGITGLWQVSGRSELEYSTRVKLDTWYVRNWTLWGDLKILLETILVVLQQKGSY